MKRTNNCVARWLTTLIAVGLVLFPYLGMASGSCCASYEKQCKNQYSEEPCGEGNSNKKIIQAIGADFIEDCGCDKEKGKKNV